MTAEEIRTFFARRDEALERHDAATLAAGYAEDCVLESPIAGTVRGRAAVEQVPNLFTTAFSDLVVDGHEL
jgi:ketosteroid isomerase-like protein